MFTDDEATRDDEVTTDNQQETKDYSEHDQLAELNRLFHEGLDLQSKQIDTPADSKVSEEFAQILATETPHYPVIVGDTFGPKLARRDIQIFLNYVVAGKQDKAEAMLIKNPLLALAKGEVVDTGNRCFQWITGFQYALWALDVHMWTMIQKYLSPEAAQEQALDSIDPNNALWLKDHGADASQLLDTLVAAYNTAIGLHKQEKREEGDLAWLRVGEIQGTVPAHVAQEYCHEKRSFSPTPDFSDLSEQLTRSLDTNEGKWFKTSSCGGRLGKHAVYRGDHPCAKVAGWARILVDELEADCNSIQALKDARVSQRLALIDSVQPACRIKLPV